MDADHCQRQEDHLRQLGPEEELLSGRRSLYLIKNVFDKDLREFSDFGGLRVGYNGLCYIRVAELATTD